MRCFKIDAAAVWNSASDKNDFSLKLAINPSGSTKECCLVVARLVLSNKMTKTTIRFKAKLFRPAMELRRRADQRAKTDWTFLILPKNASAKLPSRGITPINGMINGFHFQAVLEPDGQKSHWLRVDRKLSESAGADAGDVVTLEIAPAAKEVEAKVPADLRKALASASPKARGLWSDITPNARRDWIHWISSAKQSETRARRIKNACSMLAGGKRRVCCFDRSGFYSKSLSAPKAAT
jgi:hypothetical protein